jgi:hypothetical protein
LFSASKSSDIFGKKTYFYSTLVGDGNFIKNINSILNLKKIENGFYLISEICDCDIDYETIKVDHSLPKELSDKYFSRCIEKIKFQKLSDYKLYYYYNKSKWLFLSSVF